VTAKQEFAEAVRQVIPVTIGMIPFALIVGVTAEPIVGAGLGIFMSAAIFAGASQLAALQLLSEGAAWSVIVMTTMVINIRMVMYSASLEPHVRHIASRATRLLLSFFLVDQVYAMSLASFGDNDDRPHAAWFYMGLATPLAVVWMVTTMIGIFLGAQVPDSWGLSFAVPLIFAALTFPSIVDSPTKAAALTSVVVSLLAYPLPANLALPVAAVAAIAVGMTVERVRV